MNRTNGNGTPTASAVPSGSGPGVLEVTLAIADPEMVEELSGRAEGRERQEFAMNALRIGMLALRQARGRIDAVVVRSETDRLLGALKERFQSHQDTLREQLAANLREYFDPESGRFNERIERLIRRDGELEDVLRRQIGSDDSELVRTLTAHFGEGSDLMKLLSPTDSEGLLQGLKQGFEAEMTAQRAHLLKEFSLDNAEGALSRLVLELTRGHGALTENLQGTIQEMVGEFSLDDEDSALSRLVRRVEQAQARISSEFSLDQEGSALARLRREMVGLLSEHHDGNRKFQQEVLSTLAGLNARREEAMRSTRHGDAFEAEVFSFLDEEARRMGDVAEHVGTTTGAIRHCKVGDAVIQLGPDQKAAGARIVVEAKQSGACTLAKALEELDRGRRNRRAGVGLFVFSRSHAPAGLAAFNRFGNDLVLIWDSEDPSSDVVLHAGLSVARALSTRQTTNGRTAVNFDTIDKAIREIEKQASGLDEITTLTTTIRNNGEKILKRAGIMSRRLAEEIGALEAQMGTLRAEMDPDGDA